MRNLPIICGIAFCGLAMGADLPICEEFTGENVFCMREGNRAVILTSTGEGTTLEYFNNGKKAYLEIDNDRSLLASSGKRAMQLLTLPVSPRDDEKYIIELLEALKGDIGL